MIHKSVPQFFPNELDKKYFSLLRNRVMNRVNALPPARYQQVQFKAVLLPALYFSLYVLAIHTTNYFFFTLLYICMGIMVVLLFVNLIHEACHKNLFKKTWLNNIYVYLFDIIGANSYIWQKRHIRLHHNFPNVIGWDSDIEKSRFLKVHPGDHQKLSVKYQYWLILAYPLFITNWFLIRDFKDFFSTKTIVRKLGPISGKEYAKLFFFKSLFIGYMVILPMLVTPFSIAQIILALFLMLLAAGLVALFVLLPPHVNSENDFPEANDELQISHSWFMHQLITTNDVKSRNWFTCFVMGNCNYHLAHHLFPNISYVYAPEVTREIKHFCNEFHLPYKSYPILSTLVNHYRLLRKNGCRLEIMEDDM